MARIRSIKPEFWTDERLTECSMSARLLFVGLLNFADDNGNQVYSAKRIKMQVFPADSVDTQPLIEELIAHGLVIEYSVSGEKYLNIKGFKKHQVINRPSKTAIPPMPITDDSLSTPAVVTDGKEGKGEEGKDKSPPNPPQGGSDDGEGQQQKPKRSAKISFAAFRAECEEAGENLIPADDAVFAYADRIGLPHDFVALAWRWFKARYADKQQTGVRGWRQTFRNAVEGNWPKFWFPTEDGSWQLTTAGKQAKLAAEADAGEAE